MEKIFFDKKTTALSLILLVLLGIMMSLGAHNTLDARLYYSAQEARDLFVVMTAPEREAYFKTEIFDLLFICSYTALFIVLFGKLFPRNLFFLYLAIVPGLCDLIETSAILYALKFAEPLYAFDWLGIFTWLKWVIGAAVVIFLIVMCRRRFGMTKAG
jgi:hypothetical protein